MSKVDSATLSYLDEIPDNIYQRLITHQYRPSSGLPGSHSLEQRSLGVLEIRSALLKGEIVNKEALLKWLDIELVDFIYIHLNDKDLLNNTVNNESYTDDVLLNVLNWLDKIKDEISAPEKKADISKYTTDIDNLKDSKLDYDSFISADERYQSMQELNKDFSLERHLGWDLSKGIESNNDLNKLINTHQTIKKSRKIRSILHMIGRSKSDLFNQHKENRFNQIELHSNKTDNVLPDERAINSVTGVCLGDDVSRMVSSELAMLGSSKLKMLWHLRRAERQLLNYHYKGLLSEHVPDIELSSFNHQLISTTSVKVNGPMILCVDTSASMRGRAQVLAKAVALEAMRIAYLENRSCYLFCFSGPDEIIQLELNLDYGWTSVIKFLSLSFNGGTDIDGVLLKALNVQSDQQWGEADILLISDGRFEIKNEVVEKVRYSNLPLRVFGLQLAQWEPSAFNSVCHQVFDLSDA